MLIASILLVALADTEVYLLIEIIVAFLEETPTRKPVSGFFNCKKQCDFNAMAMRTICLQYPTEELHKTPHQNIILEWEISNYIKDMLISYNVFKLKNIRMVKYNVNQMWMSFVMLKNESHLFIFFPFIILDLKWILLKMGRSPCTM